MQEGETGGFDRDEERLRYAVLSTIYELAGAVCQRAVSGAQVGAALDLPDEDLFRVVHYLERNGFLGYLDAGPRVCITTKGLHYIEEMAGRRCSLREPHKPLANF